MRYQGRVVGLLSLLSVITYLDRVCISVAGPRMQDALNISPEKWGWITGIFLVSYGAFEIPVGAMGDRIGPRRVLTWIVCWWSAFTTLTGVISNFFILLLTRFLFGVGEAGAYPNITTVIARWVQPIQRGRACGIVWGCSQLGGALAPLLVVPIQARYGWRASFFCFGFLGLIWSAIWYGWFRDSPREMSGISAAEREELGETVQHQHGPAPWRAALRSGDLWLIMTMVAAYCYGLYFFVNWLPTYLVKGRGYAESDLPLSSLPFVVGAAMNFLGGLSSDRLVRVYGLKNGRRMVGVIGAGSATIFMIAALLTPSRGLAVIFLSFVYGGITFQQTNAFALCLDIAKGNAGMITGFMNTAAQLGGLISTVAFGYLVEFFGSYQAPLIPTAATLAISALLWLRIDATRPVLREQPRPEEAVLA